MPRSQEADFESSGLLKRAKAYIPVLIPLFVLVFKRADFIRNGDKVLQGERAG